MMPLLTKTALRDLRERNRRICAECNNTTFEDYCRQCDEFFWDGHVMLANVTVREIDPENQQEIHGSEEIRIYTCSCISEHQNAKHRNYRLQITEPWKHDAAVKRAGGIDWEVISDESLPNDIAIP